MRGYYTVAGLALVEQFSKRKGDAGSFVAVFSPIDIPDTKKKKTSSDTAFIRPKEMLKNGRGLKSSGPNGTGCIAEHGLSDPIQFLEIRLQRKDKASPSITISFYFFSSPNGNAGHGA
ncbi:hypothetical protein CEXT_748481 [Caerostris extrusa]|uniref:Uncharacterized protein n=1 Tax=Caerostris extrusa TaxID=172846 RepID=A0AAV4N9Z0_CAEEX|nr:hypothetical protein CEXT_748481 [Caerostris extrusa]